MMLNKTQRLHVSRDIHRVYKEGRRFIGAHGVIFSYKKHHHTQIRVAVIVSKKFSPKAYRRNAQRRILQAAIRVYYHDIQHPIDLIVMPAHTQNAEIISFKDACADFAAFIKKTNNFN